MNLQQFKEERDEINRRWANSVKYPGARQAFLSNLTRQYSKFGGKVSKRKRSAKKRRVHRMRKASRKLKSKK